MNQNADSAITWTGVLLGWIGGLTMNDIAAGLGIALALVRLPIEVNRLYDFFLEKVSTKCPQNRPKKTFKEHE